MAELRTLAAELGFPEHFAMYSVCPSCLVVRVVLATPSYECNKCWWRGITSPNVYNRVLNTSEIADWILLNNAEVLFVDGPEPLALPETLEALKELRQVLNDRVFVVRTCGFPDENLLRKALNYIDAVLVEYSVHIADSKPARIDKFFDTLEQVLESSVHVEVYVPYTGRELNAFVTDVCRRAPVTLDPLDDTAADSAYRLVKKLREERCNAFIHGDSSFTTLDVMCNKCGAVLVERRPWGAKRLYTPPKRPERVRCPKCGAVTQLLDRSCARRPRFPRPSPLA